MNNQKKHLKSGRIGRGLLMAACLLSIASSCGRRSADYESLGLVDVTGCVTRDGTPLEGVYVVFESSDHRQSNGVTDSGGDYRLSYNSEQTGVLPGPMTVRISSTPPGELGLTDAAVEAESVPPRYNRQSILEVIVEVGSDQRFDFDLE